MSRDEKIEKIGNLIQVQINNLKKLNVSIDSSYTGLGLFDNEKESTDPYEQLVFKFNTFIKEKELPCPSCQGQGCPVCGGTGFLNN